MSAIRARETLVSEKHSLTAFLRLTLYLSFFFRAAYVVHICASPEEKSALCIIGIGACMTGMQGTGACGCAKLPPRERGEVHPSCYESFASVACHLWDSTASVYMNVCISPPCWHPTFPHRHKCDCNCNCSNTNLYFAGRHYSSRHQSFRFWSINFVPST